MAKGIIIFGPAGSGKTTLGRAVAAELGFPYFDLDDYIWRSDTAQPFTVMYSHAEKIDRLMYDISAGDHFVMGGSMSSFHEPFDPLFELGVHLLAELSLRRARVHQRELIQFGSRILPGGDLYTLHQQFLDSCALYEGDGSPSLSSHLAWAASMPCPVLTLNGGLPIEQNLHRILEAYDGSSARR